MIRYETICYGLRRRLNATPGSPDDRRRRSQRYRSSREVESDRSRWIALVVLCAGMLMIVLDQTIVNVALPVDSGDLGFSQANLAWVVNAYLIAFGGLLLLAGRLGDLIGRRGVFLAGLALFTAASASAASSRVRRCWWAAGFVQGVGGATTSAVILGMIVSMFPEPREQAKAIGVYGFVAAAGASIGLLAGGVLTQSINWHWIFFVNLPIGLVRRPCWRRRGCRHDRGIGVERGADAPGAVADHSGADAGRLHDGASRRPSDGWGAPARRSASVRSDRVAGSVHRRRGDRAHPPGSRCASSARATCRRQRDPGVVGRGHVRMFFMGACTSSGCWTMTHSRSASPSCPSRSRSACSRSASRERLVMRFGAQARPCQVGLLLITVGLVLFALSTGPLGRLTSGTCSRRCSCWASSGFLVPVADGAGHVERDPGRTPGLLPGSSTPPYRSAGRWASRYWPRSSGHRPRPTGGRRSPRRRAHLRLPPGFRSARGW